MPSERGSSGSSTRRRLAALGAAATLVAMVACGGGGSAVRVTIPAHSTMRVAAESLSHAGVIRFPRLFTFYASIRRSDRGIKPGTYVLRRSSSWGDVLDALRGGKGMLATITIPEGWSLSQIAPTLASRLNVPVESVWTALRDSALREELDIPTPTLEGYLFPDTYTFLPGTTPRAAVTQMVHRFEQVWKPAWTIRLDTIAMSRNDVVTLASIVEKEAKLPEERPVIAAVYLNRLRAGQLLQADPTVQYALGAHQTRVYYKDLEIDSPYNTYRHKGLPPGPIASPGAPSIQAALYPANVPFRFFVAFPDGHHEFRTDFASHESAVKAARAARDSALAASGKAVAPPAPATPRPNATPRRPARGRRSRGASGR